MLLCMSCSRADRTEWHQGPCQECGGSEGWCIEVDAAAHALARRYAEMNALPDARIVAAMADIAVMATADVMRSVDERIAAAMRNPEVIAAAIMTLPVEGREIVRVLLDKLADLGR
jgi:hypothetical protein